MKEIVEIVLEHGWIGSMVAVLVAFNLMLSGLSKLLDLVKDKTPTQIDNKLAAAVSKAVSFLQSAIDWLGANREHKK